MKTKSRYKIIYRVLIAFTLVPCGLLPKMQAVTPAPDGGYGAPAYGAGNTAEGQNALFSLTTGTHNTGNGWNSLYHVSTGNFNTGIGAAALFSNTANENTATGASALFYNTTGQLNTA